MRTIQLPINSELLEKFKAGSVNSLNLISHRPYLKDTDMDVLSQAIITRLKNGHHFPITLLLTENTITDAGVKHLEKCVQAQFDAIELSGNELTDGSTVT